MVALSVRRRQSTQPIDERSRATAIENRCYGIRNGIPIKPQGLAYDWFGLTPRRSHPDLRNN